ncbi:hypothetical protein HJC23_010345 [Cyclotella cryptica]|uniref:Orc1-like AAA ATPase domain-containing protein n=1 Tax=Cyclotella cryptica TaxID=29204 RepID=A0ABD3QSK3_9STRA|eukprot:CCRYP_003777-RA/>CCRYP_003777-RA protein AED:0.01 eAED:0.01 QI:658/1/1/1/0.33/0.3/10/3789/1688
MLYHNILPAAATTTIQCHQDLLSSQTGSTMNNQGERRQACDTKSLRWGSLAASLEALCENETTNVGVYCPDNAGAHENIDDGIDSEVSALTSRLPNSNSAPVIGRNANEWTDDNGNAAFRAMMTGGRHSAQEGTYGGLGGRGIDAGDAFQGNPPNPPDFQGVGTGNRQLGPRGSQLGGLSDDRVDQHHPPYSNYVAVMSSLGHFQDNTMSYGQASQRMNPSFQFREREICEQYARGEGGTIVQQGTAVFGESFAALETYDADSYSPHRSHEPEEWRLHDGGNSNKALGSVATELDRFYQLQHQDQHVDDPQTQANHFFDQHPSHQTEMGLPPSISRQTLTLNEWIDLHKPHNNRSTLPLSPAPTDDSLNKELSTSRKNYLQQCVAIAYKVVSKIIRGMERSKLRQQQQNDVSGGLDASFDLHEEWEPRPSDISVEGITVTELIDASHHSDSNNDDDGSCNDARTTIEDINFDVLTNFNWEHSPWAEDNKANGDEDEDAAILRSVAKLLYELFMEGEQLPTCFMDSSGERSDRRESEASVEGIMEMLRMFASDENTDGDDCVRHNSWEEHCDELFTRMRDAALPIPICRLVSDVFREYPKSEAPTHYNENRMTLSEVSSDLEQMIDYPDAFLYASRTSRWELLFGNDYMFGRKKELAHLMDAALRVEGVDSPKEAILISGHAGSGKSRLVREIRKPLKERGWKFLRCKFERAIQSEPISIVALGLDEFFSTSIPCPPVIDTSSPLANNENQTCSCIDHSCQRKIIRELFDLVGLDEIRTLSQWMPSLRTLVKESYPAHKNYFEDGLTQQQQYQLTEQKTPSMIRLLGLLLELVASTCPVLFFVDDLQWADVSSLALLTSLVTMVGTSNCASGTSSSLLFIVACRIDDGMPEELVLRHLLQEFETTKSTHVSRVSLNGFDIESLNEMMSEVLCLPSRKTRSLSQLIQEKTQGMPLFVVEFVDSLLAEELLTQRCTHGWEWDVDAIHRKPIAKGVAELLSRKLERLPLSVSKGLQTLSCFAPRVDLRVIDAVEKYDPSDNMHLNLAIDLAKREYLVDVSGSTFSFSHELIQKAALDLIPMMDRIPMLLKLVACLVTKCSSDTTDTDVFLFATVDLMNSIDRDFASNNPQHSQLFAEYNLKAGKRLIELANFTFASKYLQTGISFLQGTGWIENYYLTVDLVNNLAKSSYSLGHHQDCFAQVNLVFENATSFEDKFLSYCLYINLLGLESNDKAVEKLIYLLPFAGEPIDPNAISYELAIDEMMALKQSLNGGQKDMLLHLPLMTDCTRLMSMKLLSLLVLYSSEQKDFLSGYLAVRMIQISLQHGQCDDTVYALSVFSSSFVYMVDEVDEAYALAQITLRLMENYDTKRLIPRVNGLIYGTVLCAKDTIYSTLDPLSTACQLAFSQGIHEHAILNTLIYVKKCLYGGIKLPALLKDLASLAKQHQKINQMKVIFHFLGPMYKTVSVLSGVTLDESDILSQCTRTPTDDFVEAAMAHNELVFLRVAVGTVLFESLIIRDFAKAADLILKYSNFFEILNKNHNVALESNLFFVAGLVSFHMAREMKDSHWIEKGTNALAAYENWAFCNHSNYEHKYFLLKAECHHLHGETDAAVQAYETSIESARINRFLPNQAIACELAAHFFGNIGEKKRTREMIQKSHDVYMEWGANAKAKSVIELLNLRYLDDTVLNTN